MSSHVKKRKKDLFFWLIFCFFFHFLFDFLWEFGSRIWLRVHMGRRFSSVILFCMVFVNHCIYYKEWAF